MNDRPLRHAVIGLGGRANGFPREESFDITAASEVMAVLCLAEDIPDLKRRLARIIVGFDRAGAPVSAEALGAAGPMAALLYDAIRPNLVQTTEGVPAFVHGGPFGNIAHGCNSVLATRAAAGAADLVITEAGFGFDLGAEKFFDIKCRSSGLWPAAVVLVVTVRALAFHGGGDLKRGLAHLDHHVGSVRAFGFDPIIAVNVFAGDTESDLIALDRALGARGLGAARVRGFMEGGTGCIDLAHLVAEASARPAPAPRFLYPLESSPEEKIGAVARTIYGASAIELGREARLDLERVHALGLSGLPICIAKTHLSLSDDPAAFGVPRDHVLLVRGVRVAAGAGYLLALAGDIVTMPGLPRHPAARGIDLSDDGDVVGVG
jgi:formate--tetrahydrofolate ligase